MIGELDASRSLVNSQREKKSAATGFTQCYGV